MKVLLAEDTRAVAAVMAARLTSFGCEVVVAENGMVAIEQFVQQQPDLVLMDIDMPVMDGFQATQSIRSYETGLHENAWTPIIFLTASATEENLLTAINAGGDDFMPKTVSEEVLRAKMSAMTRIAALRHSLAKANRQLARLANQDGLTGLHNRRPLDELVDVAWNKACGSGSPFSVLMIDVDNFKKYNDHYGHQMGDDCLIVVAGAIGTAVDAINAARTGSGEHVIAGRYGGEEFSVVIPNAELPVAQQLADTIISKIRKLAVPHERNAEWGIVTASVGGAHLTAAAGSLATVFRQADQQLYAAKAGGRNRLELVTAQAG